MFSLHIFLSSNHHTFRFAILEILKLNYDQQLHNNTNRNSSSPKNVMLPLTSLTPFYEHSLRVCRLFRENSEHEVSLFMGLEGGGDDDVLPCWQPQPRTDLPQVDEEL